MKNIFFLIAFTCFFNSSFSQFRLKTILNNQIGYEKNGKLEFNTSKIEILNLLHSNEEFVKADSLDGYLKFVNCSLIKINGNNYLKLFSENSTTLVSLSKKENKLFVGNIACFSKINNTCYVKCYPTGDQCPFCDSCIKICY